MSAPTPWSTRTAGPADDSGDGLLMFFVFIAAVLTSTGAVALIALAGTWWVLGLGFAIHAVMTALVVLTIVHAMAGRAQLHRRARSTPAGTRRSPRSSTKRTHRAGDGPVRASTPTSTVSAPVRSHRGRTQAPAEQRLIGMNARGVARPLTQRERAS